MQTPRHMDESASMNTTSLLVALLVVLLSGCANSKDTETSYLFVQQAGEAEITESTLILRAAREQVAWFTDRPVREAGQIPTEEFPHLWDKGENSFADDPPNADFTCTRDAEVFQSVLRLTNPLYDPANRTFTYEFETIDPTTTPDFSRCAEPQLFIDGAVFAASSSDTEKWYVDWTSQICVRNCDSSTAPECGGQAAAWDTLYDSAATCCESALAWLSADTCIDNSQHGS